MTSNRQFLFVLDRDERNGPYIIVYTCVYTYTFILIIYMIYIYVFNIYIYIYIYADTHIYIIYSI